MSSSPYAPNEPYNVIVQEELWLQGAFMNNFVFGIQTTIGVLAFFAVLRRRSTNHSYMRIALLVYIALLLTLMTAQQGLTLNWLQMGFITHRNFPGGPAVFLSTERSIPVNLAPNILSVFANWMMESLLVWRCYVVCSAGGGLWWLGVVTPLLLLMGMFVIGSLFIRQTINPKPIVTLLTYGICTLVLNLIATGFIAARLLVHRYHVVSQLGRVHGQYYVSIAMMVVESAAVYTCFLIIIIVAYATKSPSTPFLQQLILPIQAITSFSIIWRIARGEAWTRSTDMAASSVAASSLDRHVGPPPPQPNVIQLEALTARRDETEEASIQPTEDKSKVSFHKDGEV